MRYGSPTEPDRYIEYTDAVDAEKHPDGALSVYGVEPRRGSRELIFSWPPDTWRDARIDGHERIYSPTAWITWVDPQDSTDSETVAG